MKAMLFQHVAQERALHRKSRFDTHGSKEEDDDPPTQDVPLEDVPADTKVDEKCRYLAVKIVQRKRTKRESQTGGSGEVNTASPRTSARA